MTPSEAPAQPESKNPFAAPGFSRWWLGSIVAGTGVGIQSVTVPLFIRDRVALGVRGSAIAAALIAGTLPGAFLALVGGAVADRVERRRILVRTYTLAALVSLCYVGLVAGDVRVIWPVFPLMVLVGSAGAFTNPARHSMLRQLLTRTQLQNGVILGTMAFMATLQFLGPTVGGLLVDFRGLIVAFGGEVLFLAAAAVLFSGIRADQPVPTGRNVFGDLVDGLRYARGQPALLALLFLATTPGLFFIGPFSVTIALMVPDVLGASDKWVGILWGCFGAGVVIGSVLLTVRPFPRRGLAICLSNVVGGLLMIGYGLSRSLPLSAAILFVWGLAASVFMNYVVALLQEHTEPRMIGRVMSMYSLVFFASAPIGHGQAGLITDHFGPQTTLVASGVISAAIGLASVALLPRVRALT